MVVGSDRPEQAVILAGGRGQRMRPITDSVPKPMIEVAGRPFLDHLIELLKLQGIKRVLLLLGYRADRFVQHYGPGRDHGVLIDFAVSPDSDETGRRLALVRDRLEPTFLLLYGDNYWPLRLDRAWSTFQQADADAMTTVYRNRDRLSRDNVRIDSSGRVLEYDVSRRADGLRGVEIGFMLIRRSAVRGPMTENVPIGQSLLSPLASRRRLVALVSDHRYYSVGSPEHVRRAERFFAREPAVILDRDGVLNVRPHRAEYVRTWNEFTWAPRAKEALALLAARRFKVIVVTNQPGIARGAMSVSDLREIHRRMCDDAASVGGRIDRFYVCPHGWDDGCECRKPRPGMLFDAQHDLDLDLTRTHFIGDDERDAAAADAAGCPCRLVSPAADLLDHVRELVEGCTVVQPRSS